MVPGDVVCLDVKGVQSRRLTDRPVAAVRSLDEGDLDVVKRLRIKWLVVGNSIQTMRMIRRRCYRRMECPPPPCWTGWRNVSPPSLIDIHSDEIIGIRFH